MPNNPNLYPASSISNWQFRDYHQAADHGGKNTNPVTSENIMIGAGPARFSQVGGELEAKVIPLGMIESASVQQQKMVQQIREIGSRRSYVISSYSTGQLQLSKVMYSGANLLRLLTVANDDFTDNDGNNDLDNPDGAFRFSAYDGNANELSMRRQLSLNLQAEIFDRPIGLFLYFLDQRNQPYGAGYVEECGIQTHGFGLNSQGVAISESVSMIFDRITPVAVSEG